MLVAEELCGETVAADDWSGGSAARGPCCAELTPVAIRMMQRKKRRKIGRRVDPRLRPIIPASVVCACGRTSEIVGRREGAI